MNFRPVVAISLSFGLGIFLCYVFSFYALLFGAAALLAGGGTACVLLRKNKRKVLRAAIFAFVLFIIFSAGCGSFASHIRMFEKDKLPDGNYTVSATVKDIEGGGELVLTDALVTNGVDAWALHGNIRVYVYSLPEGIGIGTKVSFTADLSAYDSYSYGKFNANLILNKTKYYASVSANNITVGEEKHFDLFYAAREQLRSVLFENMYEENAALSYAMLTGNSIFIEHNTLQNFRYGGVAHIFAVSGLHIGIIYGALYFLLKKIRMHWLLRSAVIFSILFIFVGICGFSPSSVRALVMCTVLMLAAGAGFKYDKLNSVAIAAFIILIINPVNLFEVGFQLSVAAAGGIILLSDSFTRGLTKIRCPRKIASAIGVCLSAQLSTFPLLLEIFGYVSVISLFTNLLFIPLISAVFGLLLLLSVLACIFPFAAKVLLYLPELLLETAVFPISAFDMKPFLISGFIFGGLVLLWYLIEILLSDKLNIRLLPKTILCVVLCLSLVFSTLAANGAFADGNAVYICGYYNSSLVYIRAGGDYVISYGTPEKSYLTTISLRYRLKELDGLIILGDDGELNEGIPVFQSELPSDTLYVCNTEDYLSTFHTVNISYEPNEFLFGEATVKFIDEYSILMRLDGVNFLFAYDEASLDLTLEADVLVGSSFEAGVLQTVVSKQAVYFKKSEGKISVERYGNLQIRVKNGIISLKY